MLFEALPQPQFLAAFIMLTITVAFTSAFYWPAMRFPQKNSLINFYWSGIWTFLGMISAVAGAQVIAAMLGKDSAGVSSALLTALIVTFVIFVVFGWGRLLLAGLGRFGKNTAQPRPF